METVLTPWRQTRETQHNTLLRVGNFLLNSAAGRCIHHARQFFEDDGWDILTPINRIYLQEYMQQAERRFFSSELQRLDSNAISQAHVIKQLCKAPGRGGSAIAGLIVGFLARHRYYGQELPQEEHQTSNTPNTVLARCRAIVAGSDRRVSSDPDGASGEVTEGNDDDDVSSLDGDDPGVTAALERQELRGNEASFTPARTTVTLEEAEREDRRATQAAILETFTREYTRFTAAPEPRDVPGAASDPTSRQGLRDRLVQFDPQGEILTKALYNKLALRYHPDKTPVHREAMGTQFKALSKFYQLFNKGVRTSFQDATWVRQYAYNTEPETPGVLTQKRIGTPT